MDAGDQPGCTNGCRLPELYLGISGVPYHSNYKHSTQLQSVNQLEQSLADMQGPWICEVVSIAILVRPLDTIGNEIHQTRQHASGHQQSNVVFTGPGEA